MNVNIADTPPTTQEIVYWREDASRRLLQFKRRAWWFKAICYVLSAISISSALTLWVLGILSDGMLAIIVTGAIIVISTVARAILVLVVSAFTFMIMIVAARESVKAIEPIFTLSFAFSLALSVAALFYYYYWILSPRMNAEKDQSELVDLEHSTTPFECIQFVILCDEDATLKAYQHQLVKMGRKPILKEYKAAKDWVLNKSAREAEQELRVEAQLASERMTAPL